MSIRNLFLAVFFISLVAAGCGSSGSGGTSPRSAALTPILYIEDSFDTGTFNPLWNGAYVNAEFYSGKNAPFVAMDGHGIVLHYYLPKGSNEKTPIAVGANHADAFTAITGAPTIDELYFEWQEFFPTSEDFAEHGQKMFRVKFDNQTDVRQGCEMNIMALNHNQNLQLAFFHPNDGSPIDIFTNTNRPVPTGRWVTMGVWARLNTPGESDGFGRVYVDGEQYVAMENISNRGKDSTPWNILWVGGTFSNGADNPSKHETHRFIDNVKWYNTKP